MARWHFEKPSNSRRQTPLPSPMQMARGMGLRDEGLGDRLQVWKGPRLRHRVLPLKPKVQNRTGQKPVGASVVASQSCSAEQAGTHQWLPTPGKLSTLTGEPHRQTGSHGWQAGEPDMALHADLPGSSSTMACLSSLFTLWIRKPQKPGSCRTLSRQDLSGHSFRRQRSQHRSAASTWPGPTAPRLAWGWSEPEP